jgi:heme exporter protein C
VSRAGTLGIVLSLAGAAGVLLTHGVVFFRRPTEAAAGLVEQATYLLVPVAWITVLAFAVAAAASTMYLWRGDDRADALALSAAEGGLFIGAGLLMAGSLWGRVAWGAFWTWEPRLTFTLLLWFMFAGYVLVRNSARNPEHGKGLGAVVAVVGALNLPLIHWSLHWFRSLQRESLDLPPEAPGVAFEVPLLDVISVLAYTGLFLGLLSLRFGVERATRERNRRRQRPGVT